MGKSHLVLRSLLVTGAAIAVTTLGSLSASAATAPTLSASPVCKVPAMTLSSTTAAPGIKITVSGKNFSGCTAAGSTAKATPVLTVKVGVLTAAKVQALLATTKTSSDGSFSVQITVPKVSAGGEPKIAVAAISEDPATKLVYHATQIITYKTATTTLGCSDDDRHQPGANLYIHVDGRAVLDIAVLDIVVAGCADRGSGRIRRNGQHDRHHPDRRRVGTRCRGYRRARSGRNHHRPPRPATLTAPLATTPTRAPGICGSPSPGPRSDRHPSMIG